MDKLNASIMEAYEGYHTAHTPAEDQEAEVEQAPDEDQQAEDQEAPAEEEATAGEEQEAPTDA